MPQLEKATYLRNSIGTRNEIKFSPRSYVSMGHGFLRSFVFLRLRKYITVNVLPCQWRYESYYAENTYLHFLYLFPMLLFQIVIDIWRFIWMTLFYVSLTKMLIIKVVTLPWDDATLHHFFKIVSIIISF